MTNCKYTHFSGVRQVRNQNGGGLVKLFYCIIEGLVYIGRERKCNMKIFISIKEQF